MAQLRKVLSLATPQLARYTGASLAQLPAQLQTRLALLRHLCQVRTTYAQSVSL
jgi:hypothetical protein